MHLGLNPGPSEPPIQQAHLSYKRKITQFEGVPGHAGTGYCGFADDCHIHLPSLGLQIPAHFKSTVLGACNLTRALALNKWITEDAPMGNESTSSLEQVERVHHQLVRGIGIPALTANIVSSTIGAGIFVIPATV